MASLTTKPAAEAGTEAGTKLTSNAMEKASFPSTTTIPPQSKGGTQTNGNGNVKHYRNDPVFHSPNANTNTTTIANLNSNANPNSISASGTGDHHNLTRPRASSTNSSTFFSSQSLHTNSPRPNLFVMGGATLPISSVVPSSMGSGTQSEVERLQKENFDLKMQIHYLEGGGGGRGPGSGSGKTRLGEGLNGSMETSKSSALGGLDNEEMVRQHAEAQSRIADLERQLREKDDMERKLTAQVELLSTAKSVVQELREKLSSTQASEEELKKKLKRMELEMKNIAKSGSNDALLAEAQDRIAQLGTERADGRTQWEDFAQEAFGTTLIDTCRQKVNELSQSISKWKLSCERETQKFQDFVTNANANAADTVKRVDAAEQALILALSKLDELELETERESFVNPQQEEVRGKGQVVQAQASTSSGELASRNVGKEDMKRRARGNVQAGNVRILQAQQGSGLVSERKLVSNSLGGGSDSRGNPAVGATGIRGLGLFTELGQDVRAASAQFDRPRSNSNR